MKRLFATLLSLILVLCFGLTTLALPQEETEESPYRPLYEANTKLVGAPTVIENMSTAENLLSLDSSTPPQGAWLDIGKSSDLDAINIEDDKVALSYFLTCLENTIPILKIDNKKTAESVYYYLLEELATDYIIASESISTLDFFAKQDVENVILAYIAKENAEPKKIVAEANRVGASICVLQKAERETVEYLQSRFLSVTLFNEETNTRDSLDAAAECGANGVVVNSALETYKLYERVEKTTYLRKPFIVGDAKALLTKETKNTAELLSNAFLSGADCVALGIKLDSKDSAVCFADSKSANKTSSLEEICTLLSSEKNTKTVALKIEKNNIDLLKEIKRVAKKKGVLDRILIGSSNKEVINSCRDLMPEASIFKSFAETEKDHTSALLLRGVLKSQTFKTPKGEDKEKELSSAIKTASKKGAAFIESENLNLGVTLKNSIKFKTALNIFGDIEVTEIKLNKTSLELRTGKTKTIKATLSPENATNKKVDFKSSDTKVATVDKNGVITAKKAGKAVITATTHNGKKITCVVTVKGYFVIILLVLIFIGLVVLSVYFFKIKKTKPKKTKTKAANKKPKHF